MENTIVTHLEIQNLTLLIQVEGQVSKRFPDFAIDFLDKTVFGVVIMVKVFWIPLGK